MYLCNAWILGTIQLGSIVRNIQQEQKHYNERISLEPIAIVEHSEAIKVFWSCHKIVNHQEIINCELYKTNKNIV